MNTKCSPIVVLLLSFWILGAGCAFFETKEQASAEELATTGMDLYQRKKYSGALEAFQNLKDWYPFSKYTSLAELKIADAHYQKKAYEEAIFAYQEFKSLHPQNEAIPYVDYQIGLCYYDRMDSVDRDQTVVRQALEVFEQLVSQYPASTYVQKAQQRMDECRKSLAGHEMYVGRYYFKAKHYQGALARFQNTLRNYPNTGFGQEAQDYISRCQEALGNKKATN